MTSDEFRKYVEEREKRDGEGKLTNDSSSSTHRVLPVPLSHSTSSLHSSSNGVVDSSSLSSRVRDGSSSRSGGLVSRLVGVIALRANGDIDVRGVDGVSVVGNAGEDGESTKWEVSLKS